MNKEELIIKTNELYDQNKASDGELLFDEYLVEYPNDVDILLRLAVFRLVLPLPKIQKSLDRYSKKYMQRKATATIVRRSLKKISRGFYSRLIFRTIIYLSSTSASIGPS